MNKPRIGRWKSDDAEQKFHAMEQALWDDSGYLQPEPLDIPTWAGTTRVGSTRRSPAPVSSRAIRPVPLTVATSR